MRRDERTRIDSDELTERMSEEGANGFSDVNGLGGRPISLVARCAIADRSQQ